MSDIVSKIESILFISNKPLSYKKLAKITGSESVDEIKEALKEIQSKYQAGGIRLMLHDNMAQLATAPESHESVEEFLKSETSGDITRPQLETLTIIAYRGPILKEELEHIRGVNCSLILRNLMIRGLVESEISKKDKLTRFKITLDFLRFLGVERAEQLPDFDKLSKHENIEDLLEAKKKEDGKLSENENSEQKTRLDDVNNAQIV